MCDNYCNLISVDNMMSIYYKRETRKVSLRDREEVACLVSRKDHSNSQKKSISGAQRHRNKQTSEIKAPGPKQRLEHESNQKRQSTRPAPNPQMKVCHQQSQQLRPPQLALNHVIYGMESSATTSKSQSRQIASPKTINYKTLPPSQLTTPSHKQFVVCQYFPGKEISTFTIPKRVTQHLGKNSPNPYLATDEAVTRQCSAKNLNNAARLQKPQKNLKTESSQTTSQAVDSKQAILDIPTQPHLPNHRNTISHKPIPNTFEQLHPKSTYSSGQNAASEVSAESNVIESFNFRTMAVPNHSLDRLA